MVGVDADTLRQIPRRIGIARAESKHTVIRAAVTGGMVNVLITDTSTQQRYLSSKAPCGDSGRVYGSTNPDGPCGPQ